MIPFLILPGMLARAPFYTWNSYDLNRLPSVLQDDAFRKALYLASPEFHAQLDKKSFNWEILNEKEQHTLKKYYNRMCRRPVPFGTFASFGMTGEETTPTKLHLLPDGLPLCQIPRPVPADTKLTLNPTLYQAGNFFRYVHTVRTPSSPYDFRLDAIDASPFNRKLVSYCRKNEISAGKLQEWLTEAANCNEAEAQDFIYFLLAEQIFYTPEWGALIGSATPQELTFPACALPEGKYYAALERSLPPARNTDSESLIATLNALRKLVPAADKPELVSFVAEFRRRFDRRAVPLTEALDPDTGIDYAGQSPPSSVLLRDLPEGVRPAGLPQIEWQAVHKLLLNKWRNDGQPINFSDADIDALPEPLLPVTASLPLLYRQTTAGIVIDLAAGSTALQLSGRFALFSDAVYTHGKEIARLEQEANPDVIFADIHLLAEQHTDNINRRPPLYPFEIPLNVCSLAAAPQQLNLSDLLLAIRGNELILYSKKLNKRIIPRFSTAFNYRRCEMAIFRLLCDLQYQGVQSSLQFDPEHLLPGLDFYPRITYQGVIISRAKWHLDVKAIATTTLPRFVSLGMTDQQLIFDLSDPADNAFFHQEIQKKSRITLQEYFPPASPFATQYNASVLNPQTIYAPVTLSAGASRVKRSFAPGSDWLYLKLYCSPPTASEVLAKVIAPLIRRYSPEIRSWFFIRYNEDGNHLRLRIRAKSGDSGQFLAAFSRSLTASGLAPRVRSVQGDTYHREVERYGPAQIEMVEDVFRAGSELVMRFYARADGHVTDMERLQLALQCARCIAGIFFEDARELILFTKEIAGLFIAESGGDKSLRTALDKQYRAFSTMIMEYMAKENNQTDELAGVTATLAAAVRYKPIKVRRALAADLIHMQLNRVFESEQRRQEMLVYHCLYKYLRTEQAVTSSS